MWYDYAAKFAYVFWCIVLMALFMYGLRLVIYSQPQDFGLGTVFGMGLMAIVCAMNNWLDH